jgi:hypothetical protein
VRYPCSPPLLTACRSTLWILQCTLLCIRHVGWTTGLLEAVSESKRACVHCTFAHKREIWCRDPRTIVVLGTCHISDKSAADAQRVIRALRPSAVVLELCSRRSPFDDNLEMEREKFDKLRLQGALLASHDTGCACFK